MLNQLTVLCALFYRDKTHVDWVKAYLSIWTELQAYIKQHHTTGLVWSKSVSCGLGSIFIVVDDDDYYFAIDFWFGHSKGILLLFFLPQGPIASASGVSAAPRCGAAPPPPGPPPPSAELEKSGGGDAGSVNRNALFASLNKGADITKGKISQSPLLYCVMSDVNFPADLLY